MKLSRREVLWTLGSGTVVGFASVACGGSKSTALDGGASRDGGGASPDGGAGSPESYVEITTDGQWRRIVSNGIPNHPTGMFPNAHAPQPLLEQSYSFRAPLSPVKASAPTPIDLTDPASTLFGVAINGVPFDPAGPWFHQDVQTGWHFEVMSDVARPTLGLDTSNAHTQRGGRYHYHGVPIGLVNVLQAAGVPGMMLLGYGADGFPVYANAVHEVADDPASALVAARSSYRLRTGMREIDPGGCFDGTFVQDYEYVEGLGNLDECNGRDGATPEFPDGTYYYVVTDAFPFIPRLLRGAPDPSFDLHPGGPGPDAPGGGAPVPRELMDYRPGC